MARFLLKHSNIHPEKNLDGDAQLHLASRKLYLWTLLHLSRDKRTDANLVNDKGLNARDIVLMQAKHPMARQEFRASTILRTTGVPLRQDLSEVQHIANTEWNVKDAANTLALVAVLIATVTFVASFHSTRLFVHLALGTMPVAFMAAIYLVVGNNASLGDLDLQIGFMKLVMSTN
ncbi:uncharacterized protein LOC129288075 isoform X2 [Prosopis cineraria]|uniref:uncharacterized protein LOC129288075 isoform X2 n=1 Tax=Prosopis cineraria TaxID=364024 RepID=UPI00240EB8A4|nr:uncharacterized protein LOC129288075 isoform X2 [Prosopis cineraria]